MKLAIFDDYCLGAVVDDDTAVVDLTSLVPGHDTDPVGAGWWVRVCRDFDDLQVSFERHAKDGRRVRLADVTLRAAALNPGKIIAAAANYAGHKAEMRRRNPDAPKRPEPDAWLGRFGVFLKAPSSVIGSGQAVEVPLLALDAGRDVHHESELAVVMGRGGRNIKAADAFAHVLGYTIAIDVTVRGEGDRSYRKSLDTFTPLGPWVVTRDEIADPHDLRITLSVDGQARQDVSTGDMEARVGEIIEYASAAMTLHPGDVLSTGAPPGVGPIVPGNPNLP